MHNITKCKHITLTFYCYIDIKSIILSAYKTFLYYYLIFSLFLFDSLKNNVYTCIVNKEDVSLIKYYDYGTRIIYFGSVSVFSSNSNLYGVKKIE